MRKINGKLFLALLLGSVALTVTVFVVHHFQYRRIATALLWQARHAEEQGQTSRMATYLQRYLEFSPRDYEEMARLARTWAGPEFAGNVKARRRSLGLLDEVLTYQQDRPELRRLLVRVALEVGDTKKARDQLTRLLRWQDLEPVLRADAAAWAAGKPLPSARLAEDPSRGELECFWGQLLETENRRPEALGCYRLAVRHAPEKLTSYVRLAYVLRRHNETDRDKRLRNLAEADAVMDRLVVRNEVSGKAFLARWRYRRDFDLLSFKDKAEPGRVLLESAAEDVAAALKRQPNSVDVLLAAADLERLRGRRAAEAEGAAEGRQKEVAEHRKRAFAYLRRGLEMVDKQSSARHDLARFGLLWHKTNLLLDDLDRPEQASAPDAKLVEQIRETIERVRKTQVPAAADYLQGRLLVRERHWAEAAALFERSRTLLSAQPDLAAQANLYLGQCYEKLEEPQQMYDAYKRVAEWDPGSVAAQVGMAAARWAQGRLDEAQRLYTQVMSQGRVPPRGALDIARLEIQRQLQSDTPEWKDAELLLNQAARLNPQAKAEVALLRAELLVRQGKEAEADALLQAAILELKKEKPAELYAARADLAMRRKDTKQAWLILTRECQEAKLADSVVLRLAQARYLALIQGKKARKAIDKLAEGSAPFGAAAQARLLGGLADAQFAAGNAAAARRLWQRLARLPRQRGDLRLRLLLFDLAMKEGDEKGMDRALDDIRAVERTSGTFHRYGRALKMIWLAKRQDSHADRDELLTEARRELDQVAQQRGSWPPVYLARAEIDELKGNTAQAIKDLEKAIELGDATPGAVRRLVALLNNAGRFKEADLAQTRLKGSLRTDSELSRLLVSVALNQHQQERALQLARSAVREDSEDPADLVWLGQVLAMAGKPVEAETKLRLAVKKAGSEPGPWLALVQLVAQQKSRSKEALALVAQASKKIAPARAPLAVARCYEVLGRTKEAGEWYDKALAQAKDSPAVLRSVAAFHMNGGRLQQAEPLLRRLVEGKVAGSSDDDRTWARYRLAVVLANGTDFTRFTEALALVGLKLDRNGRLPKETTGPESTEGRRYQARVLAARNQRQYRQRAIALFEQLNRDKVLTPDDRYVLTLLYEAEGLDRKGQESLRELVLLPNAPPQFLARYALTLITRRTDLDEADKWIDRLEDLEKQREVPPNSFASLELRARLLEARGKGKQAEALLRRHALRVGAPPEEVLLVLASLGRQKRFDDAYKLCEHVWRQARVAPEAIGGVSVALLRVMKPTDAQVAHVEELLRTASKSRPKSTVLLMHLADLCDQRGRYDEASELYKRVLKKEPNNVVALNNLAWLLALRAGNAEEALEHINMAVSGMGRRPDLLDTRGLVHLALKQTDKALADLKEATEEAPTPTRLFHLARAYHEARDRASAGRVLRQAKAKGLQVAQLHPMEQEACRQLLAEYDVR
jgi:tetratricopeptide (TPR) repeat protein